LVVHKESCAPVNTGDLRPNNRYHIVCNEPPAKHGLQQKLWRTLLMAHKLYTKKPKTWSHSILNLPSFNNQEYRKTLLSHMIFLAESDIQCSH
ncbi:MAG: hypothetical protein KDD61_12900, partial [Bdellovibrionales bacterium]|nr:hypothetical protein [Bdellovibrionales bacterium]